MLKEGREKKAERKLPDRMWHEWKVHLMSINDIRKVQPNMNRDRTEKTAYNG